MARGTTDAGRSGCRHESNHAAFTPAQDAQDSMTVPSTGQMIGRGGYAGLLPWESPPNPTQLAFVQCSRERELMLESPVTGRRSGF